MELQGRVVVITGASSGIGEVAAQQCAEKGARLVLAARSADALQSLAERITARGGQAIAVPTDVTTDASVQHLVARTLDHFGQVDVLVNNAGFGIFEHVTQAPFADLERMMQVNLYGMVRCTQALLPHMLERRHGQIVNLASLAGLIASPNLAFYNSTKFAVVGFSRALQMDLHGTGVACAVICPGMVHTPFFEQADRKKLGPSTTLIPWLHPQDVARAIVWAIEHNRTGEIILPKIVRPLITLGRAFPGLIRVLVSVRG